MALGINPEFESSDSLPEMGSPSGYHDVRATTFQSSPEPSRGSKAIPGLLPSDDLVLDISAANKKLLDEQDHTMPQEDDKDFATSSLPRDAWHAATPPVPPSTDDHDNTKERGSYQPWSLSLNIDTEGHWQDQKNFGYAQHFRKYLKPMFSKDTQTPAPSHPSSQPNKGKADPPHR